MRINKYSIPFHSMFIVFAKLGHHLADIIIQENSRGFRMFKYSFLFNARRWVGRQTQWWPRHKAIYFSWFGPELFCLLLGPPGFNCWFSSAPVFQWCCSTPQGSLGVCRNTFLSSPHLCFIIVFICDLFVSRDDPLMSWKTSTRTEQLYVLSHDRSWGRG